MRNNKTHHLDRIGKQFQERRVCSIIESKILSHSSQYKKTKTCVDDAKHMMNLQETQVTYIYRTVGLRLNDYRQSADLVATVGHCEVVKHRKIIFFEWKQTF